MTMADGNKGRSRAARSGVTRRAVLAGSGAAAVALGAGWPAGEAQAKSRFVFANASPYDNIDPHVVFDVGRVATRLNLYDTLMRWHDNPPKLDLWAAEKYTVSSDGKQYTFTLRKGIKFHDGSEMTAEDVVYSIDRILALKKGASALYSPVVDPGSTKALDKYTVQFNLKKPFAIFMATVPEIHILNSKLVKKNEKNGDWGAAWLAKNSAGSGAYTLRKYDPAVGFAGARFKDHFMGWDKSFIDEIEFRTVIEVNSRVLGLIKGDFQGTDGYLPQDQIIRLRNSDSIQVMEQESMRIFYSIIHCGRSPMSDVNFRKALCYSFDYDGFINDILSGSVARNLGPIPNNMWGAPKDIAGYKFDIELAKKHLAMSKEKNRPITIGALAGYQQTEQAAALLQNGLNKVGIESKIVAEPWPVISNKMRDEQQMHDLVFLWKSTYYADPNNWAEMYYSPNIGSRNNSWYKNDKVDDMLGRALVETDQEKRRPLYEQAARIISEEAGGLFVYNTKWFGPFNKKVQGVRFCPIGDGQEARWMSMA